MGGLFARQTTSAVASTPDATRRQSYRTLVSQYGGRCDWLKNDQFLRDLEGDSVDAEILDEELRLLEDQQPKTCRGKTARVLETSPLQIAMCVLVLIDAGVVIAEILLDLHAMRSQQRAATSDLFQAMVFLKDQYAEDLVDYNGEGIGYILDKIRLKHHKPANRNSSTAEADVTRIKRHETFLQQDKWTLLLATSAPIPTRFERGLGKPGESEPLISLEGSSKIHKGSNKSSRVGVPSFIPGHSRAVVDPLSVGLARVSRQTVTGFSGPLEPKRKRYIRQTGHQNDDQSKDFLIARVTRTPFAESRDRDSSSSPKGFVYAEPDDHQLDSAAAAEFKQKRSELVSESVVVSSHDNDDDNDDYDDKDGRGDHVTAAGDESSFTIKNSYAEKLLKIAHILHYGSIAILGVFVIQVFLKIFGMGPEFFKNKLEVFDGVVIMASFTIDLIFVEGITGTEGEEAIALIIIFLLWRILRVINGIMITAKKRQEFRIKLQKRACRRAEKKLECLDDELSWKEKEIHNLKNLCLRKGASDEDVVRCRPKRSPFFAKMDTSAGLSSIASLSLGFTMSMRSNDSRMRLPLAHSLVSLSGHRQTVHDVYSSSLGNPSTSLPRSGHWPRSRKPSTSTVRSSTTSDNRSPVSMRQLTGSRSMEKIAEERPKHQLDLAMISSSTSMQSLAVGSSSNNCCPVSSGLGLLPTRGIANDHAAEAGTSLTACNSSRPPPSESGGVSDICIVISDVNGSTPTNSPDRDPSTQASPSDDERKSSLAGSVPSNPDQSSRTVQFFVDTPMNMSIENIAAAAAEAPNGDGCCANEFSSPSTSSQTVNGPAHHRLPSPPAVTDRQQQQREASGSLASRWLFKLRKSTKSRSHHENQVASSSDRVRRKPVWVSAFAQSKEKKTKETFL